MMEERVFDPAKLDRLNNPARQQDFPLDYVIKITGMENPEVMIDLGAGTAFFSVPFARRFENCKIYACDISDVMIEWMKKNIVPQYPKIFPLKIADSKIPLEDGVADFIFTVNLHHELEHPDETLSECYRLLKPGGIFVISDWKKEKMERGPSYELRYTSDEVTNQVAKSGFREIEIYTDFPHNFLVKAQK